MKTITPLIAVIILTAGLLAQTTSYNRKSETAKADDLQETVHKQSATTRFFCGDSLTDTRDGKKYPTVLIDDKCWMAANMNIGIRINAGVNQANNGVYEKYCYNNDEAWCDLYGGLYQLNEAWENNTSGAYALFVSDIDWKEPYVALYNWYATVNENGLCPEGWHVPDHL